MFGSHSITLAVGPLPENKYSQSSIQTPVSPLVNRRIVRLTLIERLGRLGKVVLALVTQLFSRHEDAKISHNIEKWWTEVKTGEKKIRVKVLPNDSPLLDPLKTGNKESSPSPADDAKGVNDATRSDDQEEILDDTEEVIEEPNDILNDPKGLQEDAKEVPNDKSNSDESKLPNDSDEPDINLFDDSGILSDDSDDLEEQEAEKQDKQPEPQPKPVEAKQSTKKNDRQNVESAKKPESSGKQTDVEDSRHELSIFDSNDDPEKSARDISAQKIQKIHDVIHSSNVTSWFLKAKEDPILVQTDCYNYLNDTYAVFQNEGISDAGEAIDAYRHYEMILLKMSDAKDFDSINGLLRDEFVFDTIQEYQKEIQGFITALKDDGEGKFKANMQCLLKLISLSSAILLFSRSGKEWHFSLYIYLDGRSSKQQ